MQRDGVEFGGHVVFGRLRSAFMKCACFLDLAA